MDTVTSQLFLWSSGQLPQAGILVAWTAQGTSFRLQLRTDKRNSRVIFARGCIATIRLTMEMPIMSCPRHSFVTLLRFAGAFPTIPSTTRRRPIAQMPRLSDLEIALCAHWFYKPAGAHRTVSSSLAVNPNSVQFLHHFTSDILGEHYSSRCYALGLPRLFLGQQRGASNYYANTSELLLC